MSNGVARRKDADRYRSVFDAIDLAVCVIERLPLRPDGRRDYRYVAMNPAMQSMFGVADLTGQTVRDNFPDEVEDWYDDYDRVLTTGTAIRFERESVPQGLVLEMSVTRIAEPDGCLLVAIQNVTTRKRAEEALRESEERFRLLVTAASDIVFRMSADWTAMYALEGKNVLADTSASSVTWLGDYIPESDRASVQAAIDEAVRTRSVFELEHRVKRADGTMGWTSSRAVPLLNAQGQIVEWFGAASDITGRKRAEANLAFLEAISEDLVRQTDADDMVARLGARIGEHFHASAVAFGEISEQEEIVTIVDEWKRDDVPTLKGEHRLGDFRSDDFLAACRAGKPYVVRNVAREPNASAGHFASLSVGALVSVPWIRDGRGCFQFLLADTSPRDWTETEVELFKEATSRMWTRLENLRAEHAVRVSREQLKAASARKDEFLAVLAHELRNPLAPIRTGLEFIRVAGNTPAAIERVRNLMARQVDHMVRLIDDLLEVSRITSGKMQLQRELCDLNALVHSAVDTHREAIAAKRIELTVALLESPCVVNVDPTRFVQVISNLLHNAAKFTDPGGSIRIQASVDEAHTSGAQTLVLSVSDTGIGIAPEFLADVFELFSQVPDGAAQPGLGIGLALARKLIDMHGGTIDVHSGGLGHGSEFVIRLPLAAGSPRRRPAEIEEGQPVACRVMVIDDNHDAADTLSMLVEALGGECRSAYGGEEGIREAAKYRPDVVLLDIGMPGLDGYDTCRRLRRELGDEVVLVAVTGFGQVGDKEKAQQAGFDAHLTKPADPATLRQLLSRVTGD